MSVLSKLFATTRIEGVDPHGAQDLLRRGAVLVDVREQHEWDAGHAPKARHHPLGRLRGAVDSLPADRTIVVVCRSGNRSTRGTRLLVKAGFDAVNLDGGMNAWRSSGLPLVNARGKKGSVA